jgi:F0F1-type ATP synthase assembly protein I
MPLVETLTLLASLSSAVQALRGKEDRPAGRDETSAGLLLSYEYVKASQDAAIRANELVDGRLHTLLLVSGAVVAGFVVLGASLLEDVALTSPLLIVTLVLLGFGALATAVTRSLTTPSLISAAEAQARQTAVSEWEFLREILTLAAVKERANRRLIATKGLVLELLCLSFAAQVILLSVWVLDA